MGKEFPKLEGKFVLAPMHGVTNSAFRLMARKYGASLVFSEFVSANALAKKDQTTFKKLFFQDEEKPIFGQIFSSNTENMVIAAKILEEKKFDGVDINLGCPAKRIIKQGAGGALLKRKNKIFEIISSIKKEINISLSVKIRSGIDKDNINAIEIAKICEKAGANAITIHARTLEQGYSGKADWNIIKKVKENVDIIVIGNGDVKNPQDALDMIEKTNCDYVMIGRAAIGNPFIFKQINHFVKTGKIIYQSCEEKIEDYYRYIDLTRKLGIFSLKDAKLRAQEFTKGMKGSVRLRREINKIKSYEEIQNLIEKIKKDNKI